MADFVNAGQTVLLVWGSSPPPTNIENYVNTVRQKTGADGFVQVENAEILLQCKIFDTGRKVKAQWTKSPKKAVYRSVFLTIWHCILSAELIKTHSFRLLFGDFAHWDIIKRSLH